MSETEHLPPQADAAELQRAAFGTRAASEDGGMRAAVANAMVGMKKEFYGKGPVAAKAYVNDDWVFVVLDGGLTRQEETLLAAGERDLVRAVRLRFQEVMTATVCEAMAEITGRRVQTYHSQILFDPVRTVEMFLLEPVRDG
ncbi:MAG TPA: Na-translocating system protein MpsC family protein [Baekduia sp.]|nr:Na-translocating system protein MpsC family protein [Baekduia sp.]